MNSCPTFRKVRLNFLPNFEDKFQLAPSFVYYDSFNLFRQLQGAFKWNTLMGNYRERICNLKKSLLNYIRITYILHAFLGVKINKVEYLAGHRFLESVAGKCNVNFHRLIILVF